MCRKVRIGRAARRVERALDRGGCSPPTILRRPGGRDGSHDYVIQFATDCDTLFSMRSVRLDYEMDQRVCRAAEVEGIPGSELIMRTAADGRERTLSASTEVS